MVNIPITLDRSKTLTIRYKRRKRDVRFDRRSGVPDYLYRVGEWIVANASIVDAETGVGLAGKTVRISIVRGMQTLLDEDDVSRSDGWIIKQVKDTRADGYTVTWSFAGDDTYNPLSASYTKTLPGA